MVPVCCTARPFNNLSTVASHWNSQLSATRPHQTSPRTFYQRWSVAVVAATLCSLPVVFYFAAIAVQSNVNRVEDWLPKSFQETEHLAWFRKNFASDQFIIVSWKGCQLGKTPSQATEATENESLSTADDPRLARLAQLLVPQSPDSQSPDSQSLDSQSLGARPATDSQTPGSAASPSDLSHALSPEDDAARRKYFKSVVTGRDLLDRLTQAPLNLPHDVAVHRLQGSMIGPDGSQTCLVVTLHAAALGELKQLLGSGQHRIFRPNLPPGLLRRLMEQADIPLADAHLGGPPVDNSAIDEEGERTLVRLAGLSGLLGLGLAWWSLRSIPLTLIVFFCGVMSAATSLAIVGLSGQNLDAILMSMPSLVYVLAISGAVHLVNYYREAVETGGMHGSAERAVKHAWKPALLCSVTTAVGLRSLAASELVPIRKFGIFSAAGVMSLVGIVYFFLPAALHLSRVGKRWLPKSPRLAAGHATAAAAEDNLWFGVARRIVKHYRLVGVVCLLVTVSAGWGVRYCESSIDLLKLFDSRARILQDYRWLEANLGKLVPLEIVVRFPQHTQREMVGTIEGSPDWSALSFIQRLETVTRMQSLIDHKFGPEGEDIVGRSLSAATFTPRLPAANSGNYSFIQRKAIDARLSRSKEELSAAGFLKIDPVDGSELWRISLRVAAFRDVDYGQFVKQLEQITQPLLEAYHSRAEVLAELARLGPQGSPVGKRVLLWSYVDPSQTENDSHQTFEHVLQRLLQEVRCDVTVLRTDPRITTLTDLEALGKLDAVIALGDFRDVDLAVVQATIPDTIDARLDVSRAQRIAKQQEAAAVEANLPQLAATRPTPVRRLLPQAKPPQQLDAIFTGVVPIVYQAQRALLNSLVESTVWSFLTITPIMMLVSRSILAGSVAMLPNAIPIVLIFGGMGWLDIPIDIGSMMTASIALGVAVDDTIHFLARYRDELSRTPDRNRAIELTYGHCAVPTLQAALISGLGLSVFAFSTFTPTQRFGWLMLCILIAGVVAELVLLPALLASPLGKVFTAKPVRTHGETPAESADLLHFGPAHTTSSSTALGSSIQHPQLRESA